jgi:hypothetical protein
LRILMKAKLSQNQAKHFKAHLQKQRIARNLAVVPETERQMDKGEVVENQDESRGMGIASSTPVEQAEIHKDQSISEEMQLFPLTDECYHYTCKEDFEWDTQK